jgi:2-amino-4-hydroxy-6-hydroxymethyldihydropteridine diphosphokinase
MSLTSIFLGLGSNSSRAQHLCAGLDALQSFLHELRCSPVFESEAVGIKSPPFFNLVVSAQTALSLAELDQRLKAIETANGRYAPERKALPLDIDILMYGDQVGDFAGLLLPRPEILCNAFVLWPLALLAPEVQHPQAERSFSQLWEQARISQRLWPVSFVWKGVELTPDDLREGQ